MAFHDHDKVPKNLGSENTGRADDWPERRGKMPNFERKNRSVQRRWQHWFCLAIGLMCFAFVGVQWAGAQAYVGRIAGSVTDPSGAVIPNASVTATNVANQFTYHTTTNASGNYTLPNLPPATYNLTFNASGFKQLSRTAVVVEVAQAVAIDVTMEVGTTTQKITVSGVSPLLQTQNGATGATISNTYLKNMPLVGRSSLDLAMLAPGMAVAAGNTYGSVGINFSSNGGRNMSANVLLDGANGTVSEQNTSIQEPLYVPPPDTIQEFTVQQNGFSAKYGFTNNTIINIVMKSGTNHYHGELYEYNDYRPWDARNWFTARAGQTPAVSRTNYYGFTFGGPIPHQRNKTFFFVDYQGVPSSNPSTVTEGMPSKDELNGNFGELCTYAGGTFNSSGVCSKPAGQLWDPYTSFYNGSGAQRTAIIPYNNMATYQSPGSPLLTGTPYALTATPGNMLNPVAMQALTYLPAPNLNVGTSAYNPYENWTGTGTSKSTSKSFDVRIDHEFTAQTHLTGRYSQLINLSTRSMPAWNNPMDPNIDAGNNTAQRNAMLSLLHSFSPTLVLDATLGFSRQFQHDPGIIGLYPNFSGVTTLGMPEYLKTAGYDLPPTFNVGTYGLSFGGQSSRQYRYALQTEDFVVALNKMAGRHQLEFGGEVRYFETAFEQAGSPNGYFSFSQSGMSQVNVGSLVGGDALASFETGLPQSSQYGIPLAQLTNNWEWAGYLQDTWHVTPNLTISPGLRYDLYMPATSRRNAQEWFSPSVTNPISIFNNITLSSSAAAVFSNANLTVPNLSTLYGGLEFADPTNRYQVSPSYKDFAPRFGFAYNYHGTVFRGSYGIFYGSPDYTSHGNAYSSAGFQPYTFGTLTMENNGYTPWGSLTNPFPPPDFSTTSSGGLILPTGSSLGLATNLGVGLSSPYVRAWNQVPYIQTWNFGVQHQFGTWLVGAEYVGTKGTHLYFSGANGLGAYLPEQALSYTSAQIAALETFVTNPFQGLISTVGCNICGPEVQAYHLAVPYPEFPGANAVPPPEANSNYNSLQLNVVKRVSHGLSMIANYTWEKTLDDSSVYGTNVAWLGGSSVTPQDPNNLALEYSLSQYDTPSILNIGYVYALPFGRGKEFGTNMSGPVNLILGGWQTAGSWRFDSGHPLGITLHSSQSIPTWGPQRPNFSGTLTKSSGGESVFLNQYFANASSVLSQPAAYTLGDGPRVSNIFGPGTKNANLSLYKDFPIKQLGEAGDLEIRLDTFNAFNHPQFCSPNTSYGSGSFGEISCQANSPRQVQIGAKLFF